MSPGKRSPGRPRDTALDSLVMDSVLDVIEKEGLRGCSIDQVAAQAGVSKASIYRRWDSKEDLVIDAVACLGESVIVPFTHEIRADLIALVTLMASFMHDLPAGSVFPWLVGEVAAGTEIGRHYAEAVIAPRRRVVANLIGEAIDRGDLRSDLDAELAVDMLIGPVLVRKLTGHLTKPQEGWPERIVDGLLSGWRPDAETAASAMG
jgi:AcrR family transcriptional regulator